MKNAIIINGTVYQAKRMLYIGLGTGPCDKCDLRRKCEAKNSNPCDVFNTEGGNQLTYFKKVKTIKKQS